MDLALFLLACSFYSPIYTSKLNQIPTLIWIINAISDCNLDHLSISLPEFASVDIQTQLWPHGCLDPFYMGTFELVGIQFHILGVWNIN